MYVIGLTGNIATGKSTVAKMLAQLGACVLDADVMAHELIRAGSPLHRQIVARFGRRVVAADGEIDRAALGAIVFADAAALRELEAIVHPSVIEETKRRLRNCKADVCVIEAIKLLEAGMDALCDAIWVVTSTRQQQLQRLMRDRHLSPEEAERRIAAQPAAALKIARADLVIDNSGPLEATWQQVAGAWEAIRA